MFSEADHSVRKVTDRGGPHRTCRRLMNSEQRLEIVASYVRVLEKLGGRVAAESDLPYPKEIIGAAILVELSDNPDTDFQTLEIAYAQLECFLPYDEFVTLSEFMHASRIAQEMVDPGDPTSILRSAGMMKKVRGDCAVSIQEKITRKMGERLRQVQRIIERGTKTRLSRRGASLFFRKACPCP